MSTPVFLFAPIVLAVAAIAATHQCRCRIAPRGERSRIDRPVSVLVAFMVMAAVTFGGIALAALLAGESSPLVRLGRVAIQAGWLLIPAAVPFLIRTVRLWKADHAECQGDAAKAHEA